MHYKSFYIRDFGPAQTRDGTTSPCFGVDRASGRTFFSGLRRVCCDPQAETAWRIHGGDVWLPTAEGFPAGLRAPLRAATLSVWKFDTVYDVEYLGFFAWLFAMHSTDRESACAFLVQNMYRSHCRINFPVTICIYTEWPMFSLFFSGVCSFVFTVFNCHAWAIVDYHTAQATLIHRGVFADVSAPVVPIACRLG